MTTKNKMFDTSPRLYARVAGLLYLIIIIAGFSSEFFFRRKIIIPGDAITTATNIIASPGLWRIGVTLDFLCVICAIIMAMIYFVLLNPVHKNLNILAAFFRLVSIVLQAVASLYLITALFPLDQSAYLNAFTPAQLYAITTLAIKSHGYGYGISLLFLGCCFTIHGYLIFKSGFLPEVLGILIQVAGLGYMINGFALILAPALTKWTFPIIILPVLVGETSLSLWLLVKGVDVNKWITKANKNF